MLDAVELANDDARGDGTPVPVALAADEVADAAASIIMRCRSCRFLLYPSNEPDFGAG